MEIHVKTRILILGFILSLLSGCVSTAKGPAFVAHSQVPSDQAYVYFYRPNPNDGVTVCWDIKVNDQLKGCLEPQGFIKIQMSPGQNKFYTSAAAVEFEFNENLEAGSAYYYEIDFYSRNTDLSKAKGTKSISFIFDGIHAVLPVEETVAIKKLSNLKESV